ncbi:L-tyrosine/L-tryptophan isonitrile synthase family protein [Saccharopolyspora rectivirgula]|jgi:hypothetical protein|uniref:Pyoverdine/dityrosine biosynthesis protein n=1 Tax=Saccharopolyspora rectivirgula TaxID=28042 RepID=A0A073B2B0_9PSEU|nr:L-tyrosine/L-tryptophan isonitrile synthase family protein [Saccharopolyspora rectivirgula]KEI45671.1 hypothetical protein GU90_02910 [Saccharopolyspora rectivirgula]
MTARTSQQPTQLSPSTSPVGPGGAAAPLWAPLTTAEANALLTDGGYELRVETTADGALLLTGPGTGSGLLLGAEPTWADLYRALVRLRRTRRTFNAVWLHHLTQALTGETASDNWIPVPVHRAELLTAGSADLAKECADLAGGPSRTLPFPERGTTVAALSREKTVRLEDAGHRGQAQRQLRGWQRLAEALDNDSVLRMHCAVQPVPAAFAVPETGQAAVARIPEPVPAHPAHPGGTIVMPLQALLHPAPGTPGLLGAVIANRFERREDGLAYFLEHFVRPLLRSFRTALDNHRIGLCSLRNVGFESSTELQATGRIVITDCSGVRDRPTREDVSAGVYSLVNTLDRLGAAYSRTESGRRESLVRQAIDRVIAEELRYLAPHTAELLSGNQPLQCYAHTVPESQDAVLKSVLNRVQERTRKRRFDPQLPQPAVAIGIDLCGVVPLQRILDAARRISGPRPGAPDGILELGSPATLPVLPSCVPESWQNFVRLSGLAERYPSVDWSAVHRDFVRAFRARSPERAHSDTVNAGLARFVWDVQDAGGQVFFYTAQREGRRKHTRELLVSSGVPEAPLIHVPDNAAAPHPGAELRDLRRSGKIEVVAVFAGKAADRNAITAEFDQAVPVAVEIPGIAQERFPGQDTPDGAEVIATFETTPRPHDDSRSRPRLSNTHSLEELQVGALRRNRMAQRWTVQLTAEESRSIVNSMVSDADRSATKTVRSALKKYGIPEGTGQVRDPDLLLRLLLHILTRKQFLKGSRSNYQLCDIHRDAMPFIRRNEPIDVVLFGFPVKQCLNRLKAFGPLPDLAELGGLVRLRELQRAVREVYPPGLRFNILSDGRHFRSRPRGITTAYRKKVQEYMDLAGITECTSIEEIDAVAARRLGPGVPAERARRIARYRKRLNRALQRFDITDNPLRTLDEVHEFTAELTEFQPHVIGLFREMLMSLVYSVPVAVPPGIDRITWSTAVYADLYNLTDQTVSPEVRQARTAVLRRAWHTVIRYLATLQVDEEFGYEKMFPNRIRLTVTASRKGCLGFTYLGGSGLLPWQGTGAIDSRGHVAVDFAISMLDQGFVPVYSPLLGPRQPWMMVPAEHTRLPGTEVLPFPRGSERAPGLRLDPEFAAQVRLRRK